MPKISVIIPTFNSRQFIEPCLGSLFVQSPQDFEVIVVDNNSKDGTAEFITKNYPQIVLIENRQNLGPCRARNQGISVSSGNWIMTLDCDVVLDKNFIALILIAVENAPLRLGMIQAKILNSDKRTIYSSGISLSFFRRFYDIGKNKIDNDRFNQPQYIFGACSAAALYNRRMLQELKEETGYFDERFFFLVEDVDLAWRAQKRGWEAAYYPKAICYHAGNSSGFDKKLRQYLCYRNRCYSITKNEGLMRYSMRLLPLLFYDIPRLLYLILSNHYVFKKPELTLIRLK